MNPVLVWDLPTRLFHWLLALGCAAAAIISLLLDEDSPLFPYHSLIGLAMGLMVVLRVVWGLIGSRYARFGSFAFGPVAVLEYMRGALLGGGKRHVGHNPGSAYAIFAMLAAVMGLTVTGIMMGRGNENVKDIHEVLAYALVGVVIVHIIGVAIHSVRHRENITASMIHGRKNAEPAAGIASPHAIAAIAFLGISGAWTVGLLRGYESANQTTTLPLIGISLQVGEGENESEGEHGGDEDDD